MPLVVVVDVVKDVGVVVVVAPMLGQEIATSL